MLTPEIIAAIDRLVYDVSDPGERLAIVAALDSAEALQRLANAYNWDDGFLVPTAIADHPSCDLGTALDLFWLADALGWYTGENPVDKYNRKWAAFCELFTTRLIAGHYTRGATSCKVPLGIVRLHQYKKQGVPAVLISDVEGEIPAPST
jgi:hypothetical protein